MSTASRLPPFPPFPPFPLPPPSSSAPAPRGPGRRSALRPAPGMRCTAAARRSCAAGGERDGGGGGIPAGGADGPLPGVPVRPAGRAPPGERPPFPPAPVPRGKQCREGDALGAVNSYSQSIAWMSLRGVLAGAKAGVGELLLRAAGGTNMSSPLGLSCSVLRSWDTGDLCPKAALSSAE